MKRQRYFHYTSQNQIHFKPKRGAKKLTYKTKIKKMQTDRLTRLKKKSK